DYYCQVYDSSTGIF
nr:immunoglobulin light chain junction region [Macaca mulatta]